MDQGYQPGHARLPGHTRGDDDNLSPDKRVLQLLGPDESDSLGPRLNASLYFTLLRCSK